MDLNALIKGIRQRKRQDLQQAYIAERLTALKQDLKNPHASRSSSSSSSTSALHTPSTAAANAINALTAAMTATTKTTIQADLDRKSNILLQLTYLQMLGYDVSFASFAIIELMSSHTFAHRRVAMLAASQIFRPSMDIVLLSTNLLRKQMKSPLILESSMAVNGLANFITRDLAVDLTQDVTQLLKHPSSHLRKRAVFLMLKIHRLNPMQAENSLKAIVRRLDDSHASVVCAAVSVLCELATSSPQDFLSSIPRLLEIMRTCKTNWMLIKITKLWSDFIPLDDTLRDRLQEPIMTLLGRTQSVSLLYEILTLVIKHMNQVTPLLVLASERLIMFLKSRDRNLRYLGLKLLTAAHGIRPAMVVQFKDLILSFLDDLDVAVRLMAIDLLPATISPTSVVDTVEKLLHHIKSATTGSHGAGGVLQTHQCCLYRKSLAFCVLVIFKQLCWHLKERKLGSWVLSVMMDLAKTDFEPQSSSKREARPSFMSRVIEESVSRESSIGVALSNGFMEIAYVFTDDKALIVNKMNEVLSTASKAGSVFQRRPNYHIYEAISFIVSINSDLRQMDVSGTLDKLLLRRPFLPAVLQLSLLRSALILFARWTIHTASSATELVDLVPSADSSSKASHGMSSIATLAHHLMSLLDREKWTAATDTLVSGKAKQAVVAIRLLEKALTGDVKNALETEAAIRSFSRLYPADFPECYIPAAESPDEESLPSLPVNTSSTHKSAYSPSHEHGVTNIPIARLTLDDIVPINHADSNDEPLIQLEPTEPTYQKDVASSPFDFLSESSFPDPLGEGKGTAGVSHDLLDLDEESCAVISVKHGPELGMKADDAQGLFMPSHVADTTIVGTPGTDESHSEADASGVDDVFGNFVSGPVEIEENAGSTTLLDIAPAIGDVDLL